MTTQEIVVQAQEGAPLHADEKLKRVIGPWGLGASALNIAVGAGIFVVPAFVAAILGPAAIVAYFVCGLAVALVLTCYIEIGSFVTRSGGGVAYVEEAFGPLMGFLAWVMYSVGYEVISCAALATALLSSLAFWVPVLGHGAVRDHQPVLVPFSAVCNPQVGGRSSLVGERWLVVHGRFRRNGDVVTVGLHDKLR